MAYVELHCHSAYSFLDGASQPEELAARAAELGYEALALTDHDGVYGSLEFAHAAKAFGAPADHRRGGHTRGRRPRHPARRDAEGLREPLPAAHRGARGHPAEGGRRAPSRRSCRSSRCSQHTDGLVCLSGCARHGLGTRDPNGSRARRGSVRTRALLRRAPAPVRARRHPPHRRACESSPATSASPPSPPATSTPTTRGAAALQDALVAIRCRTSLDGCEQERRGNHEAVLLAPEEMVDRFPQDRDAVLRTAEIAAGLRLRPDRGARLPLPRLLRRLRHPRRPAPRGLRTCLHRSLQRVSLSQSCASTIATRSSPSSPS